MLPTTIGNAGINDFAHISYRNRLQTKHNVPIHKDVTFVFISYSKMKSLVILQIVVEYPFVFIIFKYNTLYNLFYEQTVMYPR